MPGHPEPQKAHPEALEEMRRGSQVYPKARWAAYQNHAMDSAGLGHLQFLAIGPTNTYTAPPRRYPSDARGMGWKYVFIGWVNLETGEIDCDLEHSETEEAARPKAKEGGPPA